MNKEDKLKTLLLQWLQAYEKNVLVLLYCPDPTNKTNMETLVKDTKKLLGDNKNE